MPNVSITELQNTLDHIRQRKAARRVLAGPQNAAKPHDVSATIAKLHALQTEARVEAGKALAKLPARPTAPPRPPVKVSAATSRTVRRDAAKAHAKQAVAALKSDPLAGQSDSQLQFVAGHRSAPAEDAAAARAELQARGWTCHANGTFTRSNVKQSRR
jgi:hypothetical protein